MNKWPGAFLGPLHPASAQNKTLISNTEMACNSISLIPIDS